MTSLLTIDLTDVTISKLIIDVMPLNREYYPQKEKNNLKKKEERSKQKKKKKNNKKQNKTKQNKLKRQQQKKVNLKIMEITTCMYKDL